MDVCIFTERDLAHGDILLTAVPIGGLRLVDAGAAHDKILAAIEEDAAFGSRQDITDCPRPLIDRLRHYFLTYKTNRDSGPDGDRVVAEVYGRDEALEMIRRSHQDYCDRFPELFKQFERLQNTD